MAHMNLISAAHFTHTADLFLRRFGHYLVLSHKFYFLDESLHLHLSERGGN